jgi:hypothetical protein
MDRISQLDFLSLLPLLLCLLGCGNPQLGQNSLPANATDSISSLAYDRNNDSLLFLPFSVDSLPNSVKPFGKIVDGAKWEDNQGLHYLLISEHKQGMMADVSWVSCLYARKFDENADTFALKWEVKEYAECCADAVHYQHNTLNITDLNSDGEAETLFGYRITPDGADPEKAKLMLHVKNQKYAVRGQFAGMEDDLGKVEKHQLDPAFDQLDPPFEIYAQEQWKAFQQAFYRSWSENH